MNYEKYKKIIKEHKSIPIHKVQNMVIQNKIVDYNTKNSNAQRYKN